MKINKDIVKQVADHVTGFLKDKLPASYCYHDLSHTQNVVKAVNEIADGMKLSDHEKNILTVAAWFHDIGYAVQIDDHETIAATMAMNFLEQRKIDSDDVCQVKACIMATKYPQKPSSILEQVICDADMIHLGKKSYFENAELIREEWRLTKNEELTDKQWHQLNIEFIGQHSFFTAYCNDNYNKRKNKNLEFVSKLLSNGAEKVKNVNGKKDINREENKLLKTNDKLERGVETLFRSASGNHMRLSGMADNKAHILLSINSIIISVVLSVLAKKLTEATYLIIPTILLLTVSAISMVFAVLTTRPKVSKGIFTKEQISNREVNLLFFGNFHQMDLATYQWGIREMMYDKEYLYKSMTKDIYFLGKVLAVKYRYLNIGYMIFMFGLIASIISFGICFLMQ